MAKPSPVIYQEVSRIFNYEKESGTLLRINGDSVIPSGYAARERKGRMVTRVKIGKRTLILHRVAWCLGSMTDIPEGMVIDHINGDTLDNRFENLRCVTIEVNNQNLRASKGSTRSGMLGVVPTRYGRWTAQIKANKKYLYLGTFDSKEEAHQKYLNAKRSLHAGCTI